MGTRRDGPPEGGARTWNKGGEMLKGPLQRLVRWTVLLSVELSLMKTKRWGSRLSLLISDPQETEAFVTFQHEKALIGHRIKVKSMGS